MIYVQSASNYYKFDTKINDSRLRIPDRLTSDFENNENPIRTPIVLQHDELSSI